MKILVLLKQTPGTEDKVVIAPDSKSLDKSGFKYIVNPYDEFAIEEAIKTKTAAGAGAEVIIASFGPADTKERIIRGLAMGADRGLLINNEGLENADSLTVAKVLAAAIKAEDPKLVFCGKQGIDDDNMHVGAMTAEILGWPHINVINKFELNGDQASVEREVEGGQVEVYDCKLPVVLGANKALNKPRYAALPGIMKAKRKPFDNKKVEDYGLSTSDLASDQSTEVVGYQYPPEKPQGKLFQGEPVEAMVEKVVNLLREEAKVI